MVPNNGASQLSRPLAPARILAPSSLAPDSAAQNSHRPFSPTAGTLNPPGPSSTNNDPSSATARGEPISPPLSGGLSPIGINVEELQTARP